LFYLNHVLSIAYAIQYVKICYDKTMLKANSRKVLDIIAGQTKRNGSAAYQQIHPNTSQDTAKAAAYQLLAKPEAQIYLQEHIDKAKRTIVDLMDSEKDDIRLRSAQDVIDREHGKATQRVEQTTTGVTLTIDLTNALTQQPETAA
jgi:hypothetical protein